MSTFGFIALDKKAIFGYRGETNKEYHLAGEYTPFAAPKERCVPVDDEYAIILNIYGLERAQEYARKEGYIE